MTNRMPTAVVAHAFNRPLLRMCANDRQYEAETGIL